MEQDQPAASASSNFGTRFGIKLYRYRAILRRSWWILAVAVCIGLAYESWVLISQPVRFESVGKLVVGGSIEVAQGSRYTDSQDNFDQTQIKYLESPLIHDRAERRLALSNPKLQGTVEITPTQTPRTNIFAVAGRGANPEYTKLFVDAVMDEYMLYRAEQRNAAAGSTIVGITTELGQTREKLEQSRKDLQKFIEANDMVFWQDAQKNSAQYLSSLKNQQANYATELQRLETIDSDQLLNSPSASKGTPEKFTPGGDAQNSAPVPDTTTTSDLASQYIKASQELAQKKAEYEERSTVWKTNHPKLIAIKDEIESLQRLINTIKGQNKEATKARIETIKAEQKSLEVNIKLWEDKVLEASRKDGEYQTLQGAVTSNQSLYEKLVESISGVGLSKASADIVTVMEPASAAQKVPAGTVKHLLTGLLLGLVAGCATLFVIDRSDDRIASSTEMIDYFSEPILAQIPNVDSSRTESGLPLLQREDQRFAFSESFRSLRSSLIFMPNQGELKTLIVTSSIPSEGKSTIASNLSITMALAGARVLLVDADLRRGDLSALFDTDGRQGLSSVLRGEVPWRDVLQKTVCPTLTLMPRGPVTNQSGELLLVPLFDMMLEEAKAAYDLVIFNTAPILATDDTATIAPNFDGTLMVIRAGFTSAKLAQQSISALYQRQVNVLGIILNSVDTEMPDYHYYRYSKYYAA
jgi:capsular exopolysaccharide synthesis family protein